MFVRAAKTRKTFMPTIGQNGRRTYEMLGHYPDTKLSGGNPPIVFYTRIFRADGKPDGGISP